MKFSKYILACGCLCNAGFVAYAGEDAAITELRESIESLKSQVIALKAKDEAIEEQYQTFDKSLTDIKTQITETSQKLGTISQKLEATQTAAPADSEENAQIKSKLTELESSLNEVKTSMPTAEDLTEIKSSLAQATASIATLTQDMEAQKTVNEQQTLDLGRSEARLDKIERSNTTSSVANVAGSLLGSALQGGLGLLSQKLNASSLKESLANGEPIEELTRDMTPEEKLELEEIKQEIISGQSDQEIQAKLDSLKSKVAEREEKQRKFPETIFYGIDPFDSSTILHLLNLGRNGDKIDPTAVLENLGISKERKMSVDYVNTMIDYINLIYDWGQKGAKLKDVADNVKIISGGSPKKVVKSELLRQTSKNQSVLPQTAQQSGFMSGIIKGAGNFVSQALSSIPGNKQAVSALSPSGKNVSINQNSGNQMLTQESLSMPIEQQNDTRLNSVYIPDQIVENQSQNERGVQQTQIESSLNQTNDTLQSQEELNGRNVMQTPASQTMGANHTEGTDALSQEVFNTQGKALRNSVSVSNQVIENQIQNERGAQRTQLEGSLNQTNDTLQSQDVRTESQVNQLILPDSVQRKDNAGNMSQVSSPQVMSSDSSIKEPNGSVNQTQVTLANQAQQSSQMNNQGNIAQTVQSTSSETQRMLNQGIVPNSQTISGNRTSINQPRSHTGDSQIGTNDILPNRQVNQGTSIQNPVNSGTQILQRENSGQNQPILNNQISESQKNNIPNQMQGIETSQRLNIQNTTSPASIPANGSNVLVAQNSGTQNQPSVNTVQRVQNNQNSMTAQQTVIPTQSAQKSIRDTNMMSLEPDIFDMTVMDVDDNNYYDVTKKKFMRIAKPSSKFPKTMVIQSSVKVNPLDSFAERAANISG